LLQQHEIAVVLCVRNLLPGTWIDVLEHIDTLPNPPSLIVASRLADDRLWAEALNLGAWDVLAKPFDRTEVIRSVKSAWQRWHDQTHRHRLTNERFLEALAPVKKDGPAVLTSINFGHSGNTHLIQSCFS
jgi:FixJ family two-component response regulator